MLINSRIDSEALENLYLLVKDNRKLRVFIFLGAYIFIALAHEKRHTWLNERENYFGYLSQTEICQT